MYHGVYRTCCLNHEMITCTNMPRSGDATISNINPACSILTNVTDKIGPKMNQINPTMETVDVAIVVGANDVVNPLAKTDPNSPIAGMPIIEVDRARTVVVIKRSLSPGFAGIPNPLFGAPNALM